MRRGQLLLAGPTSRGDGPSGVVDGSEDGGPADCSADAANTELPVEMSPGGGPTAARACVEQLLGEGCMPSPCFSLCPSLKKKLVPALLCWSKRSSNGRAAKFLLLGEVPADVVLVLDSVSVPAAAKAGSLTAVQAHEAGALEDSTALHLRAAHSLKSHLAALEDVRFGMPGGNASADMGTRDLSNTCHVGNARTKRIRTG